MKEVDVVGFVPRYINFPRTGVCVCDSVVDYMKSSILSAAAKYASRWPRRAKGLISKAIDLMPQDPYYYDQRAHICIQLLDPKSALADNETSLRLSGGNPLFLITRACIRIMEKETDLALGDLATIELKTDDKKLRAMALSQRAVIQLMNGDATGALNFYKSAYKLFPAGLFKEGIEYVRDLKRELGDPDVDIVIVRD